MVGSQGAGREQVMRTSLNPLKKTDSRVPTAPDVTLGIVTHLTDDAYHANRRAVIVKCLRSMLCPDLKHVSFELIVWDNGPSLNERVLFDAGARGEGANFDLTLVRSPNIGLHNAQANIAAIARGKILCMTDDDILFSPDWFDLQYQLLKAYPNVGVVSGSPQRCMMPRSTLPLSFSSETFVSGGLAAKITTGNLLPDEWEHDYWQSVGEDPDYRMPRFSGRIDTLIEYKGVKAWAHGHHMQWMGYRDVVAPFLFRTDKYMDNGLRFNKAINDAGLLQLTTHERTAIHIGNEIDPRILEIEQEWATR